MKKSKKLQKLRFKDLSGETLNVKELTEINAGSDTMLLGYGCESNICSVRFTTAYCGSTSEICANYVCTSGIAG